MGLSKSVKPSGNFSGRFIFLARLVLSVLTLGSAVGLVVLEPRVTGGQITVSKEDALDGLPLIALRINGTAIHIDDRGATKGRAFESEGTLDFGSFQISRLKDSLTVSSVTGLTREIIFSSAIGDSGFSLVIRSNGDLEYFSRDTRSILQTERSFPVVSYPNWLGDWKPNLVIRSDLDSMEQGLARELLFSVGLIALGLIAVSFLWPRWPPPVFSSFSSPHPSDFVVLAGSILASFVIPSQSDEGWIMARAEAYSYRGYFGNLYTVGDAIMPQGSQHEGFLATLIGLGAEHIHLRLIVAGLNFLSWVLLRRIFHRLWQMFFKGAVGLNSSVWVMASIYLTGVVYFLAAIRPEGFIAFLSLAFLLSAMHYSANREPRFLGFSLSFAALAISIHQSALILAVPSMLLVVLGLLSLASSVRRKMPFGSQAFSLLTSITLPSLLLVILFFQRVNAEIWLREIGFWRASPTHDYGLQAEIARFQNLFVWSSGTEVIAVGLILNFLCMFFALGSAAHANAKFVVAIVALAPLGLVLTSSKWEWHYAALQNFSVIGWGLAIGSAIRILAKFLTERPRFQVGFSLNSKSDYSDFKTRFLNVGSLPTLLLLVSFGFFIVLLVTVSDLTGKVNRPPDRQLIDLGTAALDWLPGDSFFDSFVILAGVLASIVTALSKDPARWAGLFLSIAAASVPSFPLAVNSTSITVLNSELNQRVEALTGTEGADCGLHDGEILVESISRLEGDARTVEPIAVALNDPRILSPQRVIRFDLKAIAPGQRVGFWWRGESDSGDILTFRTFGKERVLLSEVRVTEAESVWQLVSIEVPEESYFSEIELESRSPEVITDLVLMHQVNAYELLDGGDIFSGPYTYQIRSCASPLILEKSFVENFEFASVKTIYGRGLVVNLVDIGITTSPFRDVYRWDRGVRVNALHPLVELQ